MADGIDWTPLDPQGRTLGDAREHPGFADREYVRRRDAIVAAADGHRVGAHSPPVTYSEAEHDAWRRVHAALLTAQEDRVCEAVLRARDAAPIPAGHVPQHAEVSDRLQPITGFRFTLAGGIVPNKRFLGAMADGYFHAVQYVRHPAIPLYTPEPDVLHDVFGHGTHLADPWFADLYRTFGRAAARVESKDALDLISRVYWFSLEYGVAWERGRPRAYGAALLSSYGELARFAQAEIRPWNIPDLVRVPYQVAGYQPVLFAADSRADRRRPSHVPRRLRRGHPRPAPPTAAVRPRIHGPPRPGPVCRFRRGMTSACRPTARHSSARPKGLGKGGIPLQKIGTATPPAASCSRRHTARALRDAIPPGRNVARSELLRARRAVPQPCRSRFDGCPRSVNLVADEQRRVHGHDDQYE
ncbi:hypothetical protein [Streptomyces sp. NPDC021562]|uniref:hypothetical protein n=1 Tax=Streptomyces sp. NPDC021562 TaxID=3155121 RepID=UPI0033E71F80